MNKEYSKNISLEIIKEYEKGCLIEWLNNQLEIIPLYTKEMELYTVEILITFGGPNCKLDTRSKEIKTYSYGEECGLWQIPWYISEEIESYFID